MLYPLHEAWRKAAQRYDTLHPRTGTQRGTVAQVGVLAIGRLVRDVSCPPSDQTFHVSTGNLVCWRGSLNKDMSPQKAPVLTRVSSENPQPALC